MNSYEDIENIITDTYKKYPESQIEDIAKLLYQSEFAGGHMIQDKSISLERLRREFDSLDIRIDFDEEAFEYIGGGICRLNLRALKSLGLKLETVNGLFCKTADNVKGNAENYEEKLNMFLHCCEEGKLPFDKARVKEYIDELKRQGYPQISHSTIYREAYLPAYRIVGASYRDYIGVFTGIDADYYNEKTLTIAIDGNCGAGKSSLAELISGIYDCNVFHMDDFFLRPEQRSKERFGEAGGNVDYERFGEEVIKGLKSGESFSYRRYDCRLGRIGERIDIEPKRLNIIEGSYSMHPALIKAYDFKIFLKIGEEEQRKRLKLRDGEELYKRFVGEWIPLEERYFREFNIESKADIVYTS